jgi:hypothetical protein
MKRLALLLAFSLPATAQTQLVLNKAWAAKVQNLVSIEINMEVDHSLKNPHKAGKCCSLDGDIHFSGRSDDIRLPMVAEIMNAAIEPDALKDLKADANGTTVPLIGVWRLWFEHAGGDQVQGDDVPVPDDTNPPHVFEIHPVIQFASDPVASSFSPVAKLLPYAGSEAFPKYENQTAILQSDAQSITISSKDIGYNYTHFVMQLAGKPMKSQDGGYLAIAKIMENDEDPILDTPIRVVFASGTPPAQTIASQKAGAQFHVMGIPRINLNQVLTILNTQGPGPIQVQLPYEIIVVAICSEDLDTCLAN